MSVRFKSSPLDPRFHCVHCGADVDALMQQHTFIGQPMKRIRKVEYLCPKPWCRKWTRALRPLDP